MPFPSKRGEEDGGIFGRITEEVEELTSRKGGEVARRFGISEGRSGVRKEKEGELENLVKAWKSRTDAAKSHLPPLFIATPPIFFLVVLAQHGYERGSNLIASSIARSAVCGVGACDLPSQEHLIKTALQGGFLDSRILRKGGNAGK